MIEVLVQREKRAGQLLTRFKENMDVPIAAILILNTAAHTIGAAVAGARYENVFDASTLWLFSIIFTIAVLFFTEIIPKTLGITYAPVLAVPVAHGIRWLTTVLRPLVAVSEKVSQSLRGDIRIPVTSSEEIRLLAKLGRSKGAVGVDTAGMIMGAAQLKYLETPSAGSDQRKLLISKGSRNKLAHLLPLNRPFCYPNERLTVRSPKRCESICALTNCAF